MRIGINCGHTVSGPGSGAVGIVSESIETRNVGKILMDMLTQAGVEVVDCTIDQANTQEEYLAAAVALGNRQDLDWYISIHFNASAAHTGHGVEVYTYEGRQYQDALDVCENLAALGFKNRGVKEGTGLYVIRKTKAKSMLIEVCFCDNADDVELYRQHGPEKIAEAILYALYDAGAVSLSGTQIMGDAILTIDQIQHWIRNVGASKPEILSYINLPVIFLQEGAAEGVRGDLAFCQSVWETNYFRFTGDVVPEQHNYAGLGTVGGGVKGCYFPDDRIGIRAQIQHLKGYATGEALKNDCVDPRYKYISPKGKAKTVEELGGKWAVPGYDTKKYGSLAEANAASASYGYNILSVYDVILKASGFVSNEAQRTNMVYANVAGYTLTEKQCRDFHDYLAAHGMNTENWLVIPVRKID